MMSSHHRFCFLLSTNNGLVFAMLPCLLLLLSPISCFNHPPNSPQGMINGEKTRLGSTPPSCHNKCNGCHPCTAVQIPTLPSQNRFEPQLTSKHNLFDPSPVPNNRYSNYKPLGWKCHCGNHFYNP